MVHRLPSASPLAELFIALLSLVIVGASNAQAAEAGGSVDLNTADVATLARELRGIGESRARAIVDHRQRHGPFRSVDELALVRGIGPKTVERNRARLRIGGGAAGRVIAAGVPAGLRAGGGTGGDGKGGVSVSRPSSSASTPPQDEGPIIIEGLPREAG